ncbi:recombinase family protein [Nonomuraea sp. NBC_00507]|uniref:recombinase family protein n=1 Tax=Nonomuraea sp. NBC_00507 TaxID=2976002 RepID=UPI002E18A7DB
MARRPEPVEWPDDLAGLRHGTPLLGCGRLRAAMRDASWFKQPDTTKDKYAHVVVVSHEMKTGHPGTTSGWEAAACDPTRIPLDVDGLVWDAADVSEALRCRRPGCSALFTQADRAQATETGRTYAYVRVSSRDQNPQLQLDAIEESGYDRLFTEKLSGKRGTNRPEWQRILTVAKAGDTVKFWKSDRWGRSAAHVLTTANELRERGVKVISLTENFDLDTKEGRFMFAVLAAAAEYELELRAERQAEGIAAAKRREATGAMLPGKKKTGRPRAIGPAELAALRRLVDDGVSVTEAARTLKIGRSTAYAALARR